MTTEHVALAIMHQSEPQDEAAGVNRKTGKKNFEPVESVDDRRKSKMAKLEVILPKMLGQFKVAGIAEVKAHKKSSHVYLKLVDDAGLEPIKKIVETPENSALYDGALTEIEKKNGLTTGVPKIVLCLRSTYWAKVGAKVRIPKNKKAEAAKTEVVTPEITAAVQAVQKSQLASKPGEKTGKVGGKQTTVTSPASLKK